MDGILTCLSYLFVVSSAAFYSYSVEENNRLRSELQKKTEELVRYKSGGMNYQNPTLGDRWADNVNETGRADQIVLHLGNQIGGVGDADINSEHGLPSKVNGSLNMIHGGPVAPDSSGLSQFVSPSITLFTPTRYQQEGNPDAEVRYPGRDSVSMAEDNNTTVSKQDIAVKVREHEQEILQLKKHLTDFSIKEAQIQNEKYALEKRISYMRLAAKQERLTFVSSLMPLLAEYSLQPPVADAQSIVSNVKIRVGGSLYKVVQDTKEKELKVLRARVLFRHLQEQLLVTEGKLKESQYQLAPWRSDVNPSNFTQSPVYPIEIKNGLELVPQPTYSDGKMPSSDRQTSMVEDILGLPQSGREHLKNFEHDELERHPPLASRNIASDEVPSQPVFSQAEQHTVRNNEGTVGKKVTFGDLVRSSEIDESENRGHPSDREPSANWNSKASATTTMDDPNSSYSPYLPPVLEEPSSSFSEGLNF
ncbi:UNVERIFIED_CONTAM: hypothetical protein Slati_2258200 [Sesamum latifolium]|uniref:Uncharacterized protein n=1 Tax=Sesamum latifolium TaxID=2727402 RepID=A0AAW2WV45_9LAMI